VQPVFKVTGGAQIGWVNASWPFAQLSAAPDDLTIRSRLLGNYAFTPEQVLAIERYMLIPVFAWGVRIRHCVAEYPQRIIFWCIGSPDKALQGIRMSGFLPSAPSFAVPARRGIAMRWTSVIGVIVGWNALFLLMSAVPKNAKSAGAGLGLVPLALLFGLSLLAPKSPALQRLILKPGRNIGELRPLLRLLTFISGLLLIVFSILIAGGALKN
jgi:hypothetical protein